MLVVCVKVGGMLVTTKERFSAKGLVLQQESATDLLRMLLSLVGTSSVAGQVVGSSFPKRLVVRARAKWASWSSRRERRAVKWSRRLPCTNTSASKLSFTSRLCVARCILMERMKYTGTQESSRVEGASVGLKGEDVEKVKAVEVEAKVVDDEDSEAVEALVEEGRVLGLPLRALPVMSSRGSWSMSFMNSRS